MLVHSGRWDQTIHTKDKIKLVAVTRGLNGHLDNGHVYLVFMSTEKDTLHSWTQDAN